MKRSLRLGLGGAGLVLALASCAHASEGGTTHQIPIVVTDDPAAESAYRDAKAAESEGRIDAAIEGYESFIERFPEDPLAPSARLELARVLLAKGDVSASVPLLEGLVDETDEELRERAWLHLGLARHMEERDAEAVELLLPLDGKLLDPNERALHSRTLAASCIATERHGCAVEALDVLVREEEEDEVAREALLGDLRRIVEGDVDDDELASLYGSLPRDGAAWPLVAKRRMTRVFASGDVKEARAIANDLRTENVELSGDILAMAQRAEIIATPDPNAIGLLLPLSGRGQEAGQEALRGVMTATGRFDGNAGGRSSSLVIRDTGSDPERTVRAIDELVAVHRVMAIVGAIDGAVSAAAAARCEELGVPFISLSVSAKLEEGDRWTFRLLPSALPEARALARAAHSEVGPRARAAVLRPESGYAERVSAAFVDEAGKLGMNVGRELTYEEGTRDFRKLVDELRRLRPDVIFLPERPTRVSVLAPMLASAGLWVEPDAAEGADGTRLVLPSVAWDESLLSTVGRYLEGAIVALPFRVSETGTRFVASYADRYGRPPSVFATSAHDAYLLIRDAMGPDVTTREEFQGRVSEASPAGVVGPAGGFDSARRPRAHASIATVKRGALEPQTKR